MRTVLLVSNGTFSCDSVPSHHELMMDTVLLPAHSLQGGTMLTPSDDIEINKAPGKYSATSRAALYANSDGCVLGLSFAWDFRLSFVF